MARILIARAVDEAALALLDARGDVEYEVLETPSVAELEARIAALDAVLLGLTPVQAPLIAKAKRLKVVSRFGVGYDNVDVGALTAQGIALTTVGDANAVTVAEHALMLMLAATRELVVHDAAVRGGDYGLRGQRRRADLWRKTVLVVGFGRIGQRVARLCDAFGMTVVVADPYVAPEAATGFRHLKDFHDGLGEADFVTLHMPARADGTPVLGPAEFAAMKPGAFLVNTARGSLVDEDALHEALIGGRLRGAGLDVTRQEPPAPDCPLLELDNVVLTPHIGSLTEEGVRRMSMESVRNCLDGIDGRLRPEYVVNPEYLVNKAVLGR
ncbi:MAG: hydroxyacid dehydrogenase [Proteobacteria bacterium]|nr:hydroxyacid dehydrogenase [Pseudomonadota bacterium]